MSALHKSTASRQSDQKKSLPLLKFKNPAGFTLIELIVVIIILGILAGVALPRFISQTQNARKAALAGLAGNLSSGVALAQQNWLAEGNSGAGAAVTTMNGATVSVTTSYGAPLAVSGLTSSGTVNGVLASISGFSVTAAASNSATIQFAPTVTNCYIVYKDGAGAAQPTVESTTTGC